MSHLNNQIVRLYDTVFDRAPDAGGLEFWNNASDHGLTLNSMADQFITAPEFAATYGQPSNLAFIREMYSNVLDRTGEAEGVAFWTRVLDEGLANRSHIVVSFSESAEHIAQMASVFPVDSAGVVRDGLFVYGTSRNDTINGGGGTNTIVGGPGGDVLTGGPGTDVFVFRHGDGQDRITDYQLGDHIRFEDSKAGDVGIVAAHGPPNNPGEMSSFAGYDVYYGVGPTQGSFHLDGITYTDLQWVQDSFQYSLA